MAHFPVELITEILECLPVKSVIRFKCLSKSLLTIIDTPGFKISHHRRSSQNINRHKLIIKHSLFAREDPRFHAGDMNLDVKEYIPLEGPNLQLLMHVSGYCNGLILVDGSCNGTIVWNPSMLKYMYIPRCPCEMTLLSCYMKAGLGLGYDASTDDYKAVSILSCSEDFRVWIYGIRSKVWRRVHDKFPNSATSGLELNKIGHFVDGSIHWLRSVGRFDRRSNVQPEIVSFDVRKEIFSLLPPPLIVYPTNEVVTELHVLEGRLCISFYWHRVQADLYTRKKNGVGQVIWEQLYPIREAVYLGKYRFEYLKVLGYSNTSRNKILLKFEIEDALVSYDVERRSVEMLEKLFKWSLCSIFCSESIVWFS